jgi:hypothetical protein
MFNPGRGASGPHCHFNRPYLILKPSECRRSAEGLVIVQPKPGANPAPRQPRPLVCRAHFRLPRASCDFPEKAAERPRKEKKRSRCRTTTKEPRHPRNLPSLDPDARRLAFIAQTFIGFLRPASLHGLLIPLRVPLPPSLPPTRQLNALASRALPS